MDIHKPKAAHSWREFAVEIGTIVCGILIALGLEQGVEAFRAGREARETDRALQTEVRADLGEAMQDAFANACVRTRIADLADKLTTAGDTWKGQSQPRDASRFGAERAISAMVIDLPLGQPNQNLWDSAAVTKGLSHLPAARARRYSDIYRYIGRIQHDREVLLDLLPDLQPLVFDQALDTAGRRQYLRTLLRFDHYIYSDYIWVGLLVERAKLNGIEPDAKDLAERLAQVRRSHGDCARPYVTPNQIKLWAAKLERGAAE